MNEKQELLALRTRLQVLSDRLQFAADMNLLDDKAKDIQDFLKAKLIKEDLKLSDISHEQLNSYAAEIEYFLIGLCKDQEINKKIHSQLQQDLQSAYDNNKHLMSNKILIDYSAILSEISNKSQLTAFEVATYIRKKNEIQDTILTDHRNNINNRLKCLTDLTITNPGLEVSLGNGKKTLDFLSEFTKGKMQIDAKSLNEQIKKLKNLSNELKDKDNKLSENLETLANNLAKYTAGKDDKETININLSRQEQLTYLKLTADCAKEVEEKMSEAILVDLKEACSEYLDNISNFNSLAISEVSDSNEKRKLLMAANTLAELIKARPEKMTTADYNIKIATQFTELMQLYGKAAMSNAATLKDIQNITDLEKASKKVHLVSATNKALFAIKELKMFYTEPPPSDITVTQISNITVIQNNFDSHANSCQKYAEQVFTRRFDIIKQLSSESEKAKQQFFLLRDIELNKVGQMKIEPMTILNASKEFKKQMSNGDALSYATLQEFQKIFSDTSITRHFFIDYPKTMAKLIDQTLAESDANDSLENMLKTFNAAHKEIHDDEARIKQQEVNISVRKELIIKATNDTDRAKLIGDLKLHQDELKNLQARTSEKIEKFNEIFLKGDPSRLSRLQAHEENRNQMQHTMQQPTQQPTQQQKKTIKPTLMRPDIDKPRAKTASTSDRKWESTSFRPSTATPEAAPKAQTPQPTGVPDTNPIPTGPSSTISFRRT